MFNIVYINVNIKCLIIIKCLKTFTDLTPCLKLLSSETALEKNLHFAHRLYSPQNGSPKCACFNVVSQRLLKIMLGF